MCIFTSSALTIIGYSSVHLCDEHIGLTTIIFCECILNDVLGRQNNVKDSNIDIKVSVKWRVSDMI